MRIDKESRRLKKDAIKVGLCDEWTENWGDEDVASLCSKFVRGIDFCIKHNYPSMKQLDKFKGLSEKYGVITNQAVSMDTELDFYVFNGDCSGVVKVPDWGVVRLYIRHSCSLIVELGDNSICHIDLHDEAKVQINGNGKHIIKHG